MIHLVECRVGKEEKEAMHVPHSCRDQQQSGSEYFPMSINIFEMRNFVTLENSMSWQTNDNKKEALKKANSKLLTTRN